MIRAWLRKLRTWLDEPSLADSLAQWEAEAERLNAWRPSSSPSPRAPRGKP